MCKTEELVCLPTCHPPFTAVADKAWKDIYTGASSHLENWTSTLFPMNLVSKHLSRINIITIKHTIYFLPFLYLLYSMFAQLNHWPLTPAMPVAGWAPEAMVRGEVLLLNFKFLELKFLFGEIFRTRCSSAHGEAEEWRNLLTHSSDVCIFPQPCGGCWARGLQLETLPGAENPLWARVLTQNLAYSPSSDISPRGSFHTHRGQGEFTLDGCSSLKVMICAWHEFASKPQKGWGGLKAFLHGFLYSHAVRQGRLHMGIEVPVTHPCSVVQPRRNENRSAFLPLVKNTHFQTLGPILTSIILSGLYTVSEVVWFMLWCWNGDLCC